MKEETKPSTSIANACTMIEANMVSMPSKDLSHFDSNCFSTFEVYTKGIGCMLMKQMDYDEQGLGKKEQGIKGPILVEQGRGMKI